MINTIMSSFALIIVVFVAMIFGLMMVDRGSKAKAFLWLFDSRTSKIQLSLYFGFVCLSSLFIYQAYASVVDNVPLDIAALGKGVGVIFGGMGISSIGSGLQTKEDAEADEADDDDPTEKLEPATTRSSFFMRLFNSNDKSMEAHLFLGALALFGVILYQGYDLAYISSHYDPEDYGYALAYAFVGIGAASWSQGVQRKIEEKAKAKVKKARKPKTKTLYTRDQDKS